MVEIWEECVRFQIASQRLADQVRTIIKEDLFSGLELLELQNQKINRESRQQTVIK